MNPKGDLPGLYARVSSLLIIRDEKEYKQKTRFDQRLNSLVQ